MRLSPILFLALFSTALSAEPTKPAYPLWDGLESVADYAQRVNLPPTESLDLGKGVKMEFVLIPPGKFIMGIAAPEQPHETIAKGQIVLIAGLAPALCMLVVIALRAIRKRQRPKFSLLWLIGFVLSLSVALYGGVHWQQSEQAWRDYAAAKARYEAAFPIENRAHPVTLSEPFYMSKFVLTPEQYELGRPDVTPFDLDWDWRPLGWFLNRYAGTLKPRSSHPEWISFRSPTDAEWNYACGLANRKAMLDLYDTPDDETYWRDDLPGGIRRPHSKPMSEDHSFRVVLSLWPAHAPRF